MTAVDAVLRNERRSFIERQIMSNSSTSYSPVFVILIMPYRALYRLIEKPPPIVPEAAFYFYSASREIEREFSNHDFESTGRTN
jgi:hypothetical protein